MGEYKIIKGSTVNGISSAVHIHMNSGWKCQGGVSALYDSGGTFRDSSRWFYQAMVKEE